jgi:hypothetical protein
MTMSDYLRCADRNESNFYQKGNLERSWSSIKSDLSVGIPLSLEHLNMIHEIFNKNPTPAKKNMLIEIVDKLVREVVQLEEKVCKFKIELLVE